MRASEGAAVRLHSGCTATLKACELIDNEIRPQLAGNYGPAIFATASTSASDARASFEPSVWLHNNEVRAASRA
jgi:hypothetical protein